MRQVLESVIAYEELKRMREARQEAERPRLYIEIEAPRAKEEEAQEEERGVIHIPLYEG